MKNYRFGLFSLSLAGLVFVFFAVSPAAHSSQRWSGCCGATPWEMGPGMMWGGNGPMPRHHLAMMWGIPEPYRTMTNPLPLSRKTVKRGAAVYKQNCMACHGTSGAGDGEAGVGLAPPPGNLVWLSRMPMVKWDPFMYWTIAEGGVPLGTAMPAFKDTLAADDIWAVIAYIQARLPANPDAQSPK